MPGAHGIAVIGAVGQQDIARANSAWYLDRRALVMVTLSPISIQFFSSFPASGGAVERGCDVQWRGPLDTAQRERPSRI